MSGVMHIAAECRPFAKVGGLGDVLGALPGEQQKLGIDVSVMLPLYQDIPQEYQSVMQKVRIFVVQLGWRRHTCELRTLMYHGIRYYFLGNDYYFNRAGIYGFADDMERFAFLSQAALAAISLLENVPKLLHLHDWHTATVSLLLKSQYKNEPNYANIVTILTLHNVAYRGATDKAMLTDLFAVDSEFKVTTELEEDGLNSFLLWGMACVDAVTTVSPSFAKEISYGSPTSDLTRMLTDRKMKLIGILNGIDPTMVNPSLDPYLSQGFDGRSLKKRRANKNYLQQKLGLNIQTDRPLIGMVSRLVAAKGLELLTAALEGLMLFDVQLVVLGTGNENFVAILQQAAKKYPEKIAVRIAFDEILAHQIYAGSDIFLMPSKNEPCGISAINALRYGSIPVVHASGGLADIVIPFMSEQGEANGFLFTEYAPQAMLDTVREAVEKFADTKSWQKLMRQAMSGDYSWKKAAQQYRKIYQELSGSLS